MKLCIAATIAVVILCASSEVVVTVDPTVEIGPIKAMNAVNNGPTKARADQSRGNFADFQALRIPYARTHDSIDQATSNGHTVDISAVFPDFNADETDPANYDFAYTDLFLDTIIAAGAEPFFRLGQTIENGIKKYHVKPPKDFSKWARICEHVMAHYLEGWADGFKHDIRYWEIWNEPDAQPDEKKDISCQWGGTKAQFFSFFEIAAKHLKKRFPDRMIGGPSLGFSKKWAEEFLAYQQKAGTPIDFFSHHWYGRYATARRGTGVCPHSMSEQSSEIRKLLDSHGYGKSESILNEWNYVRGWSDEFPYSCLAISSHKGGAFVAAAMSDCQNAPVDMLMYYDARPGTVFNGLFDLYTLKPRPAYYALLCWSLLRELGTQVLAKVDRPGIEELTELCRTRKYEEWFLPTEMPDNIRYESVTAVAAKGGNGSMGLLLARYNDNDNVTSPERIQVRLAGSRRFPPALRIYTTDSWNHNTMSRIGPGSDGSLSLVLEPNAFVYVEW